MIQKNSMLWLSMALLGCWLGVSGCTEQQTRSASRSQTPVSVPADSVARRFQEGSSHSQTVVQSAVELSEKYSTLSEEAAALRQRRHELETENATLKLRIEVLEKDLTQCKGELNEANSLLMDVLAEMNKWKSDVLGVRHEMRESAKAQMTALLKILEMMGAEMDNDEMTTASESTESSTQ